MVIWPRAWHPIATAICPTKTNILSSPHQRLQPAGRPGDAPKSRFVLQKSGSIFMLQGSSLLKAFAIANAPVHHASPSPQTIMLAASCTVTLTNWWPHNQTGMRNLDIHVMLHYCVLYLVYIFFSDFRTEYGSLQYIACCLKLGW